MVKWQVVIIGILLFLFFLFLPRILSLFGITVPKPLTLPYGYILILFTSALFILSGFLPYNWSKISREIGCFLLFILIILVEMALIAPFVKRTEVSYQECKAYFLPVGAAEIETKWFEDALFYSSCILTGYFPTNIKETREIGWATFYIFYIIAPFAFIFALIYGLMRGLNMDVWFGEPGIYVTRVLALVISLYATRVMFGGLLLGFAGYGAWGLGMVFLAILFTKGLSHMMDAWYKVEEMAEKTREAIETELREEKEAAKTLRQLVRKSAPERVDEIRDPGTLTFREYMKLSPGTRARIEFIMHFYKKPEERKRELLKLLAKIAKGR